MDISNALIPISKETILRYISEHDIYNHYLCGEVVYDRPFSSPLRDDNKPSFIINGGNFLYKDFATGDRNDCFEFVNQLYGGNLNFVDTLKKIATDLNIDHYFEPFQVHSYEFKTAQVKNVKKGSVGGYHIQVKTREFKDYDLEYWESYGVDRKHLKLGDIFAISHYFINGKQIHAEKYAYAYVELKDGKETYKIYQPFSKKQKWINNNDFSVWELWRLLPKSHDTLIITSSRKDALSIINNFRVPATSFQAESVVPKPHVVEEIQARFDKVYLFYDNDFDNPRNPGQTLAKKRIDEFGFTNLYIPEVYGCKDFSDLVHQYGIVNACMTLSEIMKAADETNAYKPLTAS